MARKKPKPRRKPMPKPSRPMRDKWRKASEKIWEMLRKEGLDD